MFLGTREIRYSNRSGQLSDTEHDLGALSRLVLRNIYYSLGENTLNPFLTYFSGYGATSGHRDCLS